MLNAIILEDEEDSRNLLSGFLKDYFPQINLVAATDTVASALDAIRLHQPDLVFLDIQLRGETCFDLLDKLDNRHFEIIFTTAYDSYMLKAIKLSAIDYLLKPINVQELKTAVEKAEKKKNQLLFNKSLEVLISNFRNNLQDHKIAITSNDGYVFVKISNILYLKSEGAYTYFFLKPNEKIITSKNIKEYEDLLSDHNFFRIHKSYIVNMGEVTRYIRGEGGSVVMSNNATFDVSRRRKDDFLKLLYKA